MVIRCVPVLLVIVVLLVVDEDSGTMVSLVGVVAECMLAGTGTGLVGGRVTLFAGVGLKICVGSWSGTCRERIRLLDNAPRLRVSEDGAPLAGRVGTMGGGSTGRSPLVGGFLRIDCNLGGGFGWPTLSTAIPVLS